MSRNNHHRGEKSPAFVMVFKSTLDTAAWRAMSHGAQALYIALKRQFNGHNNGHVYLSQRDASKVLESNRDQIVRWFREQQHYGFIVKTSGGSLGTNGKGYSPHWRLTELPCNGEQATRDYLRWNGDRFTGKPKTESRTGNRGQGGPGLGTGGGHEIGSASGNKWPRIRVHNGQAKVDPN